MAYLADKILQHKWQAIFFYLGLAILGLQLVDAGITQSALNSGWFVEGNRIIGVIAGEWWFPVVKGGVTFLVLAIAYRRINHDEHKFKRACIGLAIITAFYVFVVTWNLTIYNGIIGVINGV